MSREQLDRRDTARQTRRFSWRAVTGRQPAARRWRQLHASVERSSLLSYAQTRKCQNGAQTRRCQNGARATNLPRQATVEMLVHSLNDCYPSLCSPTSILVDGQLVGIATTSLKESSVKRCR